MSLTGAEPKVTLDLALEAGLTAEEYDRILSRLGREPTYAELGLFSALWSEHCAYKHSRVFLSRLPQSGPHVLQGPGENAGAIDIGDGWAVVFKIESHNHPSFIEPFQGAATGVGGILRDIFTMGARPIAILDSLRFGEIDSAKTRQLVHGVVSGISWYGNCFGCPTVGGEIAFAPEYAGNPLVNVMCVGLVRADQIFRARAEGPGNPVFYVGNKTGRDGIHGATMASATFDEHAEERRPTVQVGDPFTEKLLPARWAEARPPTRKELNATSVLRLPLDEASAKIRTGGPDDGDTPDAELDVWAPGAMEFLTIRARLSDEIAADSSHSKRHHDDQERMSAHGRLSLTDDGCLREE